MASLISSLMTTTTPSIKVLKDLVECSSNPSSESFVMNLSKLKTGFYENSSSQHARLDASNVAEAVVKDYSEFFPNMFHQLPGIPFETRKDLAAVFNFLLVNDERKASNSDITVFVTYVDSKFEEINSLLLNYIKTGEINSDIALLCGSMIRSLLHHELLYSRLLKSPEKYIYPFLDEYVHLPNFEVASDAFSTLQEILRTNSTLVADLFLENDAIYDTFFNKYTSMLMSSNYLTKRLSIKLLSEILLDRTNFNTMMKYISEKKNLMISMLLLRDASGNIQLEVFHVFKIFVANPSKPPEIKKILLDNKVKLVAYLEKFHSELHENDLRFRDEKALLIQTLNNLQ